MADPRHRLTVPEGAGFRPLTAFEAPATLSLSQIKDRLNAASDRLRRELRLRESPFTILNDSVAANGLAGIVRLLPGIEIEIVPKCLPTTEVNWHDDFLLIATVTRLGRTFPRERVSAGLRMQNRDVLTLLAAVFLESLQVLNHVPIREYRKYTRIQPSLDAELDYSEVWSPRPEGYLQTGPILSTDNPYLAVIAEAATYLADATADAGIGHRLRRAIAGYPTTAYGRSRARVPGRFARWQDLYDLALAVSEGFGVRFGSDGTVQAPGFILNTERGWEDLLTLALVAQGDRLRARAKPPSKLGTRSFGKPAVYTYPDVVLCPPTYPASIVVDAKYKGTATRPVDRISNDDLYEVLAFLSAQDSELAILLYPGGPAGTEYEGPGVGEVFDEVTVGTCRVMGVRVSTAGIGKSNGFAEFGHRLTQLILNLASMTSPVSR